MDSIGKYEKFSVIDLYHKKQLVLKSLVKYKQNKSEPLI